MALDQNKLKSDLEKVWQESAVPTLVEYIKIPNKSPLYDPTWRESGHMSKAMELLRDWASKREISGMKMELIDDGERSPLLFIEIDSNSGSDDTVLLYGHMDKQPESEGWRDGLGPWTPVIEGDKLYGRGGADDGYSIFAALLSIEALQAQNVPHARMVVMIEAGEESGSPDIPYYIENLEDRIGSPSLIVCLDSGAGDYEHLWLTNALRGFVMCNLHISLMTEGVHSGAGSGIVASSFRVLRQLLSRIEDENTGEILLESFKVDIPESVVSSAKQMAEAAGKEAIYEHFPMRGGVTPVTDNLSELVLNNTWRPTLCITGVDGMPALADAGNVLRDHTSVKLSLRLPPTADPEAAMAELKKVLTENPPYGAEIKIDDEEMANGFAAPSPDAWFENALSEASRLSFGAPYMQMGEGGSIPFMAMLLEKFPKAEFMVTGVLGPGSNAHGPNEFLHIPAAINVTTAVAHVLAAHANKPS